MEANFVYFRRRALDAGSMQIVCKSMQHYATERHAYSIVRYPTPDLRIYVRNPMHGVQ